MENSWLAGKEPARFVHDVWHAIFIEINEQPNGHPRETEDEFKQRLSYMKALHSTLGVLARASYEVAEASVEVEDVYTPETVPE